jgi:hypothetical protein
MFSHRLVLSVALFALVGMVLGQPQPAAASNIVGDVNCSGSVDSEDAERVLMYASGVFVVMHCSSDADVDLDDVIDSVDALLILQLTAGIFEITTEDALDDAASRCQPSELPSNGAVLAQQVVTQKKEFHADLIARDRVATRFDSILRTIAAIEPRVANIRISSPLAPGVIIVTMDPELDAAVRKILLAGDMLTPFVTGFNEFDAMNAKVRLRGAELMEPPLLALCFKDTLNVPFAVQTYYLIPGILEARPIAVAGDGSVIEMASFQGTLYVVAAEAQAGCPATCAIGDLMFFTVTNDTPTQVAASQAIHEGRFPDLLLHLGIDLPDS